MESLDGFDFNDLELFMEELELEMNQPLRIPQEPQYIYHHREGKLVISLGTAVTSLKRCLTFRKHVGEVVVTVDGTRQKRRIAPSSSTAEFIFDIYEYFGSLKISIEVYQYKVLSKQLIGRVELCLHDIVNMQEKNEVRAGSSPNTLPSIPRLMSVTSSSSATEFWGCIQTLPITHAGGGEPSSIHFSARYISLHRCLTAPPLTSYSDFHSACLFSTVSVVTDLLELFSRKSLLRQVLSLQDTVHNLTPFHFAIAAHNLPVVKVLLMRVGNCCFLNPCHSLPTPFHTAIEYESNEALNILLRFMTRHSNTISYSALHYTYNDLTILQYAVQRNNIAAIRIMMPYLSSSETVFCNIAALRMACSLGYVECARLLMTNMPIVADTTNEIFNSFQNPLFYALKHPDEHGITALIGACRVGAEALVQSLLPYADYKAQCKIGNTGLHYAVMNNHMTVIALLLKHDTTEWQKTSIPRKQTILMHMTLPKKFTHIRNDQNQQAIDIARQNDSQDIITMLQAHEGVYRCSGSSQNSSRASSDEPDVDDAADNNLYAFASKRYYSSSNSSDSYDEKVDP